MTPYVVTDTDGNVLESGTALCDDEIPCSSAGRIVHAGLYAPIGPEKYRVVDGAVVATGELRNPPSYAQLRRAAYPPMADYLDGVVKGDQQQIAAYLEKCRLVKARYPKPS